MAVPEVSSLGMEALPTKVWEAGRELGLNDLINNSIWFGSTPGLVPRRREGNRSQNMV